MEVPEPNTALCLVCRRSHQLSHTTQAFFPADSELLALEFLDRAFGWLEDTLKRAKEIHAGGGPQGAGGAAPRASAASAGAAEEAKVGRGAAEEGKKKRRLRKRRKAPRPVRSKRKRGREAKPHCEGRETARSTVEEGQRPRSEGRRRKHKKNSSSSTRTGSTVRRAKKETIATETAAEEVKPIPGEEHLRPRPTQKKVRSPHTPPEPPPVPERRKDSDKGRGKGQPQGKGWREKIPYSSHPRSVTGTNKGITKRAKQEHYSKRERGRSW